MSAFYFEKTRWIMEKNFILASGIIGGFVSFLVDGLGMSVTILLGMMALDYMSGLMSAAYQRKLNSRIGFNGLIRKSYYLLLVGAVYMMGFAVEEIQFAGDGLAIALIAMEFISITENGTKMNLPMPAPVRKILLIVNEKFNGKEGKQ